MTEKQFFEYKTIYRPGEGEVVEKKSRFIALAAPADSEEEALRSVEAVRKKYWDARHHCYAFVIGEKNRLKRFSDDGEPNGTAGRPILDILEGNDLTNAMIIVTRYFGGTLLGTGGLARAYSGAARAALASSRVITRIPGRSLHVTADYTDLGRIQHLLAVQGIKTLDVHYTDKVELEVLAPQKQVSGLIALLTEATGARARTEEGDLLWYAEIDGQAKVLE